MKMMIEEDQIKKKQKQKQTIFTKRVMIMFAYTIISTAIKWKLAIGAGTF